MVNLTDKCVYFGYFTKLASTLLYSLFSRLSVPQDTKMLKLAQLITLQWPLGVRMFKRSFMFLILNQQLEMIKLSEEGTLKA